MIDIPLWSAYGLPLLLILLYYLRHLRQREARSLATLQRSAETGLKIAS